MVAAALTGPGDTVLMEDPSYFLAHDIFRDLRLELVAAPQCEPDLGPAGGVGTLDLDRIEAMLESGLKAKLLYLVPTGNNPTGATMYDPDRARLVQICTTRKLKPVPCEM